jgi:hypothetical protein
MQTLKAACGRFDANTYRGSVAYDSTPTVPLQHLRHMEERAYIHHMDRFSALQELVLRGGDIVRIDQSDKQAGEGFVFVPEPFCLVVIVGLHLQGNSSSSLHASFPRLPKRLPSWFR